MYCKIGQELYYVTCKVEDYNKFFIPNEDKLKFTNKDCSPCWPTHTKPVMACFNVFDCGHALCNKYYLDLMTKNDDAGNKRYSRRR